MKKTLCSALTTALVVGAASTTFAAANPFSDVPADHWAYDAVSELAADGIIEGYGDSTFRGQRQITRYEMAQMVAKAMAKSEQADAQTRALIDRLAAEFSDELNNLGVRVSALEEKVDNVKWTGELRYTYERTKYEHEDHDSSNELLFRLEPTATVNDHWKVKARLDAYHNTRDDNGEFGGQDKSDVKLKRAYAEGTYGSTVIDAGLMPVFTTQGVVLDDEISGISATFGAGKEFSATLLGGRIDLDDTPVEIDDTADLWAGILKWMPSEKFSLSGEYVRFGKVVDGANKVDANGIWGVGATYAPDKNWHLDAGYWKSNADNVASKQKKAYNFELGYKGANPEDRGSFGLFAAYRHLGERASYDPTFDGILWGTKGWELGAKYTFARNIVGTLIYADGKDIEKSANDDYKRFFGRVEFFF